MSDEDGLVADMHRLLWFLEAAPSVADSDTVERLLAGRLGPSDVPPGYEGVARLLAAATAPAAPEELAGEPEVLVEFGAVRSHPPTLVPRRATMLSKLASVKVAAAVLLAVLSIGSVAAAATGLLRGQADQAADRAPSTTGAGAAGRGQVGEAAVAGLDAAARHGLCQAWQAGQGADHGRRTDAPAMRALAVAAGGDDNVAAYCKDVTATDGPDAVTGPDAGSAAKAGLCQAWLTGQGDHGRRADSVAFQALAAAAGGADKIATYCRDAAPGSADAHGPGSSSPGTGSVPSTTVSPPSSGPPADPGSGGQGQGGPPTTG
jgi:hypothetical protein